MAEFGEHKFRPTDREQERAPLSPLGPATDRKDDVLTDEELLACTKALRISKACGIGP